MENKQTAFEWYIEQHNILVQVCDNMSFDERFKIFSSLVDKAKEMEKEQIKSAFNIGELMAHDYFYGNDECAENYYNQTYGGNK
jgi:hypothetical protein